MESVISQENEKPVFYNRDVMLTKLVIDELPVDLGEKYLNCTVYYSGSNNGRVHKVVQWIDENRKSHSNLLDVFDVTSGELIQAIEISKKHKALYIASDHDIKQIDLVMCLRRYDSCLRCVRDPYCGWDKDTNTCKSYISEFLQDVLNRIGTICDSSVKMRGLDVKCGQLAYLHCFVNMPEGLANQEVRWYHTRKNARYQIRYKYGAEGRKFIVTSEKNLIINGVNEKDAGRYDCWLNDAILCSYNITVNSFEH